MGPLQISIACGQRYQDQHLELDFEHRAALLDTRPVALTRKEYDLLALLIQNAGDVVRREMLLLQVWGYNSQIRTRTLDVHIRRLREALSPTGHAGLIETVRGAGYRFKRSLN